MDELKQCPHDDWTIKGSERIGSGTCSLCGETMHLAYLMLAWKARIEREFVEFREAQTEVAKRNDDFLNT